jgi:hypothetical protein
MVWLHNAKPFEVITVAGNLHTACSGTSLGTLPRANLNKD